jgi:predicted transcriptional regulator
MPKKGLKEDAIDLRRERVLELTSQGYSQRQIANMLQTSHRTVGFDQIFLRQKAKDNIRHYTDERLPEEYEKCLVSINSINREAWTIVQGTEDNKEKIQALSLAKECCSMKLDLLIKVSVMDDAVRFVHEYHSLHHKLQQNSDDTDNDNLAKSPARIDNDNSIDEVEGETTTTDKVFKNSSVLSKLFLFSARR